MIKRICFYSRNRIRGLGLKAVIMLILIITLSPITNIVMAEQFETMEKEINIIPDPRLGVNTNNIAGSNFTMESDFILSEIETDGIYYGPYAQSSLFQFDHIGGNVVISSMFKFTQQQIINGCSRFTARLPTLWTARGENIYSGILFTIKNELNIIIYSRTITNASYLVEMGNYGIYIDCLIPIIPNKNYTFTMDCSLLDNKKPIALLTIEQLQISNVSDVRFYKTAASESSWGTIWTPTMYDFTETLEYIYPAWAFIFVEGMGENGIYGTDLEFSNGETLQAWDAFSIATINGTNLSIYLPFRQRSAEKVDWVITLTLFSDYADIHFINPANVADERSSITMWINDTEHYLLFSSAFWIELRPGFPPFVSGGGTVTIELEPNRDITLINQYNSSLRPDPYWGLHQFYILPDNEKISMNYFISMTYTEGQWAIVEPSRYYTSYDFGWGNGKIYPGIATMVFYIENGSSIFASGSLEGLRNSIYYGKPPDEDEGGILERILRFVKTIPGKVRGFIDYLWGKIKALGNFVWNMFMGLIDWLIEIVSTIKDYATSILYGFLNALVPLSIMTIIKFTTDTGTETNKKREGATDEY